MEFRPPPTATNDLEIMPFKPQSDDEAKAARIIRMMLHYHILRTQIEGSREMSDNQRKHVKQCAVQIRLQGFRDERMANLPLAQGMILFDDEVLKQEGTRIAYAFGHGQIEDALNLEELTIALSVNRALYGIDVEDVRIAA
jgi:hypothetical protein